VKGNRQIEHGGVRHRQRFLLCAIEMDQMGTSSSDLMLAGRSRQIDEKEEEEYHI